MATIIFLSVLAAWILSVMIHEYAHARVALAGGDTSVRAKGYLTMNPMRYLHPVTSVVIPLVIMAVGGIPLPGGAVWIETGRLRTRHWVSAVSAAGPLSNLLLLVLCAAPFYLGLHDSASDRFGIGWLILAFFCYLQCFAVIINLLPIPGIDGWGILEPYMKPEIQWRARRFARHGFFILLAIFIIDNPVGDGIRELAYSLCDVLHIPVDVARLGRYKFSSLLNS